MSNANETVLTQSEIEVAQALAYQDLRATGFNGGMGGATWDMASARAIERAVLAKLATQRPIANDAVLGADEHVCRNAIAQVCEGWTLPHDVRKILEAALWSQPSAQQSETLIFSELPNAGSGGGPIAHEKARVAQPSITPVSVVTTRGDEWAAIRDLLGTLEKHDGTIERCAWHANAIRKLLASQPSAQQSDTPASYPSIGDMIESAKQTGDAVHQAVYGAAPQVAQPSAEAKIDRFLSMVKLWVERDGGDMDAALSWMYSTPPTVDQSQDGVVKP
jgi:hypothetical protein